MIWKLRAKSLELRVIMVASLFIIVAKPQILRGGEAAPRALSSEL